MDYIGAAFTAWFAGFFPLAEIYVAVPAAMALGLDDFSVIFWTVFGNFTPALLISVLYFQMQRIPRLANWMDNLVSEKVQERINRWDIWVVLFVTPWTGIWAMAVTAKVLRLNTTRFLIAALISITIYAIGILLVLRLGLAAF